MNSQRIKRVLTAVLGAAAFAGAAQAADISGAGATFPYPIYSKWADAYKQQTGIGLNYQSIGSGGGIKQIKAKTVTFGATDMPLKPEDLKDAGLVQFPMIIGGVVPVVNIKGVQAGQMVLDGATVASIYLGEITKWNDPRIQKLNPKLALPATSIAPIYRSDGSGTNFLFSHYLSQTSPKFKETIGENTSVQWPIGIGAKGNEGVAGRPMGRSATSSTPTPSRSRWRTAISSTQPVRPSPRAASRSRRRRAMPTGAMRPATT
jgi:phosphate transport system substrate-binding protein